MQTIKQGLKEKIQAVIYLPRDPSAPPDAPLVVDPAATVQRLTVTMTPTAGLFGTVAQLANDTVELDTSTGSSGDTADFAGQCVVTFDDGRSDETLSASDSAMLSQGEQALDVFAMVFTPEQAPATA